MCIEYCGRCCNDLCPICRCGTCCGDKCKACCWCCCLGPDAPGREPITSQPTEVVSVQNRQPQYVQQHHVQRQQPVSQQYYTQPSYGPQSGFQQQYSPYDPYAGDSSYHPTTNVVVVNPGDRPPPRQQNRQQAEGLFQCCAVTACGMFLLHLCCGQGERRGGDDYRDEYDRDYSYTGSHDYQAPPASEADQTSHSEPAIQSPSPSPPPAPKPSAAPPPPPASPPPPPEPEPAPPRRAANYAEEPEVSSDNDDKPRDLVLRHSK